MEGKILTVRELALVVYLCRADRIDGLTFSRVATGLASYEGGQIRRFRYLVLHEYRTFIKIQIPGGKYFALRYEVAPSDVLHGETIRETGEITIRFGELAIREVR